MGGGDNSYNTGGYIYIWGELEVGFWTVISNTGQDACQQLAYLTGHGLVQADSYQFLSGDEDHVFLEEPEGPSDVKR